MANQRRAGVIQLKRNGEIFDARGSFSCGYGAPKREAIIGADRVHGYKEQIQVPYIEGQITDRGNLDVKALFNGTDDSISVEFANGKIFTLGGAWFAGDGVVNTEEGEIPVRWEGITAEEVG